MGNDDVSDWEERETGIATENVLYDFLDRHVPTWKQKVNRSGTESEPAAAHLTHLLKACSTGKSSLVAC